MQFKIRDAQQHDSDGLIALTALAPMKGSIGLRIDRKPDFFKLLHLNDSFIMLVAENSIHQITGCIAATKKKMYIDGKISIVYNIRDFKVHPGFKNSRLAYYIVKKMYARLLQEDADILCCTIASGNDAVAPFLTGRGGIPPFIEIAKYNIYNMLPSYNSTYKYEEKKVDPLIIADFFNTCFKNFSISPYEIQPGELNDCIHFLSANEKHIDAAIAAFDPFAYRQNVVIHYSFSIAVMLAGLRFLKFFFKLPSLPEKNKPLRIIYAKYYAFIPGNEIAFKNLILQLRHYAYKENYNLLSIATDEKDRIINKLLKPISRFVFKSTLLATSLRNNEEVLYSMKKGISFEDYCFI